MGPGSAADETVLDPAPGALKYGGGKKNTRANEGWVSVAMEPLPCVVLPQAHSRVFWIILWYFTPESKQ